MDRGFLARTSTENLPQQVQPTTYFHGTDAASLPPRDRCGTVLAKFPPQTGPDEIVTIDKHRVPGMDQSKTKEAKGGRIRIDVQ